MEIKPCPNCEKEGILKYHDKSLYQVVCETCQLNGPQGNIGANAISLWNDLPRSVQGTQSEKQPVSEIAREINISLAESNAKLREENIKLMDDNSRLMKLESKLIDDNLMLIDQINAIGNPSEPEFDSESMAMYEAAVAIKTELDLAKREIKALKNANQALHLENEECTKALEIASEELKMVSGEDVEHSTE